MELVVYYRKLSTKAICPTKGYQTDAGYDLYSPIYIRIKPHDKVKVNLDIQFMIPKGYFGKIESRSSFSFNNSVIVLGGIIDQGFVGNIAVCLFNLSNNSVYINPGDRIAQILFLHYGNVKLISCKELPLTD